MSSSWTVKSEAMTKRLCFGSTFCASFLMNSSNSTRPAQHWFDEQTQTTPPVFPTFLIQMTTKGPGQTKDIDVLHLRMCCSLTWSEIAIFVVCVGPYDCPAKNFRPWPNQLGLSLRQKWSQKASWIAPGQFGCPLWSKLGSKWKIPKLRERPQNPCPSRIDGWNHSKVHRSDPPVIQRFSSRFHVIPQFHKTKKIGGVPVDPQRCTFKDVPRHAPRLHTKSHLDSNFWIKFPNLSLVEQNTTEWQIAKIDRYTRPAPEANRIELQMAKWSGQVGRYIEGNQAKEQSKWTKAMSKLA